MAPYLWLWCNCRVGEGEGDAGGFGSENVSFGLFGLRGRDPLANMLVNDVTSS